jgi:hypothetical protein
MSVAVAGLAMLLGLGREAGAPNVPAESIFVVSWSSSQRL